MDIQLKAAIAVVFISFAITAYAYPSLPQEIATHWNAAGEVDGHMPAPSAFFVPALSLGLLLLFLAIPKIDPLQANIRSFIGEYHKFILVIVFFLSLVHLQSLLWNLGTRVSFSLTMPALLGGLFIYLGTFLGKSKRNWFIGIRTPWTLSSDEVWDKTHQAAGKAFMAAGILSLAGVVLPAYAIWIALVAVLVAALGSVAYSYVIYSGTSIKTKDSKILRKDKRI